MDVNVINSFLLASYDVLGKELGVSAEKGPISLCTKDFNSLDFTIRITISGGSSGIIWYTMDQEAACRVASKMVGSEVTDLDEMARSALGELGNMISGLAAMHLEKASIDCTLSSPIILEKGVICSLEYGPAITIPLLTPLGSVEIKVSLVQKSKGANKG